MASEFSSDESSSSKDDEVVSSLPTKRARRRKDPGRRVLAGRLYDSKLGVNCHFCRQKTIEDHALCSRCPISFCGRCLRTRHGENIEMEKAQGAQWVCPKCRGGCGVGCSNCCACGPCRKLQNLAPPSVVSVALHAAGFTNVHDYLIHVKSGESPDEVSARKNGKGWCVSTGISQMPSDIGDESVHGAKKKEDIAVKKKEAEKKSDGPEIHSSAEMAVIKEEEIKSFGQANRPFDSDDRSVHGPQKHTNMVFRNAKTVNKEEKLGRSSVPMFLCMGEKFKKSLEAKLQEPFDTYELQTMWQAISCRKPVLKVRETRQRMSCFATKKEGHSYLDHHPELANLLELTKQQEDKLKLLRGFFFWLEHAGSLGVFKPWLAHLQHKKTTEDCDCIEIEGLDCQVLGMVCPVDEEQKEMNFAPDRESEEDTKPKIPKTWIRLSFSKPHEHVKEEPVD